MKILVWISLFFINTIHANEQINYPPRSLDIYQEMTITKLNLINKDLASKSLKIEPISGFYLNRYTLEKYHSCTHFSGYKSNGEKIYTPDICISKKVDITCQDKENPLDCLSNIVKNIPKFQ